MTSPAGRSPCSFLPVLDLSIDRRDDCVCDAWSWNELGKVERERALERCISAGIDDRDMEVIKKLGESEGFKEAGHRGRPGGRNVGSHFT